MRPETDASPRADTQGQRRKAKKGDSKSITRRCIGCGHPHPASPARVGLCPECWRWKRAYWDAVGYLARCLDDHGRLPPESPP
jgi:hypothetical protein